MANLPAEPSFPLLKLHPELILCLFSVLPPDDAIALALCSKRLFALGSPLKTLEHWTPAWYSLMRRLERDLVSTHVFCPDCFTLESFTARSLRAGVQSPAEDEDAEYSIIHCRDKSFSPSEMWWRGGLDLGYHFVRLVMNQYHYDRVSDITLDAFRGDPRRSRAPVGKASRTGTLAADGKTWTGSWSEEWATSVTPRIIDGDLYLRSTHVLEFPTDPIENYTPRSNHRVCNHQSAKRQYEIHLKMTKLKGEGRPDDVYARTLDSCPMCLTDFTFQAQRAGKVDVYTIEGFHNLGSFFHDMLGQLCWKYEAFTDYGHHDFWLQNETRIPYDEEFQLAETGQSFGTVKEAWLAAEKQDSLVSAQKKDDISILENKSSH